MMLPSPASKNETWKKTKVGGHEMFQGDQLPPIPLTSLTDIPRLALECIDYYFG
jgi:hypothetical protein